jgi:F-box-like
MELDDMQQVLKKMKSESDDPSDDGDNQFTYLPENVLINIFKYLSAREILNCSECCKRWNYVSRDSLLWRSKFRDDFKIESGIKLKPSEFQLFVMQFYFWLFG